MAGIDPVSLLALAVAGTAVSAGTTVAAAVSQNKAIKRQQDATRTAATQQQQQLVNQAQVEKLKRSEETHRILGRIRAASGEAGLGLGGSVASLQRQALIDQQFNNDILGKNLGLQLQAVSTGAQADLNVLSASRRSVALEGISAGIGGFDTGLRIGSSVNKIFGDKP